MSLGKAIARYRKQKSLKQSELAEMVGVSQSYVARWETNRDRPRRDSLKQIAEALEIPVEKLLLGGKEGFASSLESDDVELVEMITKIPKLASHELAALKTVLASMLIGHRIEETRSGVKS